nr:DRTGG domain-containing protein [Coprothermobacter platensis]
MAMSIKVSDLLKHNFTLIAGEGGLNKDVDDVYICDLLSWVMAKAKQKSAWITIQSHVNIVAVALMADLSCIIIAEGVEAEKETIDHANEEGLPVLNYAGSSYEAAIELYHLLTT